MIIANALCPRTCMALIGLCVLISACQGGDPTAPIERDEFIEVMVELRLAAREFTDPSAFDSRKAEILVAAGVTDSTLIQFARAHQRDPAYMSSIWEIVDERVNSPPFEPDTSGVS
jgi:hypothetical protein